MIIKNRMNILELKRTYRKNCTTGELSSNDAFICFTIERPWVSNLAWRSCVPPGDYELKIFQSKKHLNSFSLSNSNLGVSINDQTPRTAILIHTGNWMEDVVGCLSPGEGLTRASKGDGEFMVTKSANAMKLLNKFIKNDGENWTLRILM